VPSHCMNLYDTLPSKSKMAMEPGTADPNVLDICDRLAGFGTHPGMVRSTISNSLCQGGELRFSCCYRRKCKRFFFLIPLSCQAGSAKNISSELAAVAKLHCSSLMRAESNSFEAESNSFEAESNSFEAESNSFEAESNSF
jgi:hypothetical protein